MQNELLAENPATTIRILGINLIGSESGNSAICDGRDIPWLQDTVVEEVWLAWQVATVDDVIILDEDNIPVAVYNLVENDLSDSENYAELKQILKEVAGEIISVPTLSEWGLIIFMTVIMGIGVMALRKRRMA